MAARLSNPFPQFWSSSAAYAGGTLYFYATGTSTPLAVYSDHRLVTSIGTSIGLDGAGRFETDVFLQNQDYKVVLKDADGVTIWTADPVSGSDTITRPIWSSGSGSPNGVVAGTAGSAGVLPDVYWDYLNAVQYVCTTSGTTTTAVWAAINASAATPAVPEPQGRLTPTQATPVISADVISATGLYYTPYKGNLVPIYNGSIMVPTEFTELTLLLASQHALNQIYDVFVFSNSGVLTLVTGPAWSTATAGSGARGSGAGTTQLARVKGLWTNAVSMTGRNGSSTFAVGANLGTYLGSIFIDGTAGQVTCHTSYGQSRKFGIWNAYNRKRIVLKGGDGTASWAYNTATVRPSNNSTANSLSVFAGLPEDGYDLSFIQTIQTASSTTTSGKNIIGWNATNAISGTALGSSTNTSAYTFQLPGLAAFNQVPSIGVNVVYALETANTNATTTFMGTEANMLLSAKWDG